MHTPPERAFDEIARLAARLCGTPIAMVSLVGAGEQWWKARVGTSATGTPREHAFCAHCILDPEALLVVEDATHDPRFHDNPLVTGDPGIRFYAGAPLVTRDGLALGALCVIDRAPRALGPGEADALRALARSTVALFEERRRALELQGGAERRERPAAVSSYAADVTSATAALEAVGGLDEVTGLYNRRALVRRLREEIARSERSGLPLTLLALAPDADAVALATPDAREAATRAVALLLAASLRAEDVAFHLEPGQFAVLLPLTTYDEAMQVAERLRRGVASRILREGPLTVSVGVAERHGGTRDGVAILGAARHAMHAASSAGGNQCVGFHIEGSYVPPRL